MNKQEYKEYLQTEHWRKTRKAALVNADYACQICFSGGNLNVHHRTYERIGRERLSDLTVLCEECHAKFHDKLPVLDETISDDDAEKSFWDSVDMREFYKSARDDGLGRWIELAWLDMCLKWGMTVKQALLDIEIHLFPIKYSPPDECESEIHKDPNGSIWSR